MMKIKVCKQKDHKWDEILPLFPRRYKCTVCGVFGRVHHGGKSRRVKILPLTEKELAQKNAEEIPSGGWR